jgi:TolA-binding protein
MSAQHTERPPISSNENHPKSIATNTDTDTIATMTTSSQTQFEQDPMQTIQTLHQQVQQLQAQLAQRQELLLTQERQAHSKVLQQYEERMQALQLKCFISETRSRAFEEALEQHVATVANNVALLMTPRKFSNETNAAPLLDDVSTGDTTTTIATKTNNKPLYSRATSKNLNNTNN